MNIEIVSLQLFVLVIVCFCFAVGNGLYHECENGLLRVLLETDNFQPMFVNENASEELIRTKDPWAYFIFDDGKIRLWKSLVQGLQHNQPLRPSGLCTGKHSVEAWLLTNDSKILDHCHKFQFYIIAEDETLQFHPVLELNSNNALASNHLTDLFCRPKKGTIKVEKEWVIMKQYYVPLFSGETIPVDFIFQEDIDLNTYTENFRHTMELQNIAIGTETVELLYSHLEGDISKVKHSRNQIRSFVRHQQGPLKVIVGENPGVFHDGWISTSQNDIDVTNANSFKNLLGNSLVDMFLSEHMWEHLHIDEAYAAAINCYNFMKPGGRIRVAVPDPHSILFNSSLHDLEVSETEMEMINKKEVPEIWSEFALKNDMKHEHKIQFTIEFLEHIFLNAGFEVERLEYWNFKTGNHFCAQNCAYDVAHFGRIKRSLRGSDPLGGVSLIIDAFKGVIHEGSSVLRVQNRQILPTDLS